MAKTSKKRKGKPAIGYICGGCANEIAKDDTAGQGGCAKCGDGIPRCSECHELHCAECDGDE